MILKMIKILVIISLLKCMNNTFFRSPNLLSSCEEDSLRYYLAKEEDDERLERFWNNVVNYYCKKLPEISNFRMLDDDQQPFQWNGEDFKLKLGMSNRENSYCYLFAELPDEWENVSITFNSYAVKIQTDSFGAVGFIQDNSIDDIYATSDHNNDNCTSN